MDTDKQLRVLVVDDDPDLVALLTRGLEVIGHYEVIPATDGAEGLEHVDVVRPDCIVVDVRMPGINGYQFVRALRGDPRTTSIPIVMLSALIQDRGQLAGMLSGADAYLIKPVRLAELVRALEQALHLSDEERRTSVARLVEAVDDNAGN